MFVTVEHHTVIPQPAMYLASALYVYKCAKSFVRISMYTYKDILVIDDNGLQGNVGEFIFWFAWCPVSCIGARQRV